MGVYNELRKHKPDHILAAVAAYFGFCFREQSNRERELFLTKFRKSFYFFASAKNER